MRFPMIALFVALIGLPTLFGQAVPQSGNPPRGTDPGQAGPRSRIRQDVPVAITIEQALALAEQSSPLLMEANASVQRSQAAVQTAKAYTNPGVDVILGHQSAEPIATPGVPGVLQHYGASQTIEIPAERRTRIAVSEKDLGASKYRTEGIRLSVTASVKRAFYDVIRRKEQLANANANLSLVEDLERRVQLEVEVGELGRLELTRAEAELARARAAVRSADAQVAVARAMLKAVIGSNARSSYDTVGTLGGIVELPPLERLRHQILTDHPGIAEVNALIDKSRIQVENQQARRIPQPTFTGEYERQPDLNLYRFGVTIPLPFWDQRKGPIAEAAAEVRRAEALGKQREVAINAALESAYDQYQISSDQVEGLQAGSLKEAEAAVAAAMSAYRYGERGIVEVLDAQRVLQGVRADLLDALYSRQSALIDLEELGVTHQ